MQATGMERIKRYRLAATFVALNVLGSIGVVRQLTFMTSQDVGWGPFLVGMAVAWTEGMLVVKLAGPLDLAQGSFRTHFTKLAVAVAICLVISNAVVNGYVAGAAWVTAYLLRSAQPKSASR